MQKQSSVTCSDMKWSFAGPAESGEIDAGDSRSDAGALLLGATDRAIGLVGRCAPCSPNPPHQGAGRARRLGRGSRAMNGQPDR